MTRLEAAAATDFDRTTALTPVVGRPGGGGDRALIRGHLRPLAARPIDSAWLAMATASAPAGSREARE